MAIPLPLQRAKGAPEEAAVSRFEGSEQPAVGGVLDADGAVLVGKKPEEPLRLSEGRGRRRDPRRSRIQAGAQDEAKEERQRENHPQGQRRSSSIQSAHAWAGSR